MDLPNQNAKHIQMLNQNNIVLEKNITTLSNHIKNVEDTVNNMARDAAAMQRAIIEFLKEKQVIRDEDDIKLLQKLHLKNIAQLDQEITERRTKRKKDELA